MSTPLEEYDGVFVKREDLHPSGFPSGKLRGVLPFFENLKQSGVKLVVNAGATHSNSHAIVSYAAKKVGLDAATFVNSNKMHPAVEVAERLGCKIILTRPMHLGPLRAKAKKWADENGGVVLPWGLTHPQIIEGYAKAVKEFDAVLDTIHVVPFGAGGWAAGVYMGVQKYHGGAEQVAAVPVMPTSGDEFRLKRALGLVVKQGITGVTGKQLNRLPSNIYLSPSKHPEKTPWPSDSKYEHVAWSVAKELKDLGCRVVFWSIGQAIS